MLEYLLVGTDGIPDGTPSNQINQTAFFNFDVVSFFLGLFLGIIITLFVVILIKNSKENNDKSDE